MSLDRGSLERQLEIAKNALDAYKPSTEVAKNDPTWRALDAKRRTIATRLHRVAEGEKQEAELAARKAEKESAE